MLSFFKAFDARYAPSIGMNLVYFSPVQVMKSRPTNVEQMFGNFLNNYDYFERYGSFYVDDSLHTPIIMVATQ